MKVTILVAGFPPRWTAGTEIATYNIAKHLAKRGHEVHIITSLDEELPRKSTEEGFYVHRIQRSELPMSFSIKALLEEMKINSDIIHAQGMYMGFPAYLIKKILGRPYVIWSRGSDVYLPWKYKNLTSKVILRNTDVAIALTEDMRREMRRIYERDVLVLPNGIDSGNFDHLSKEDCRKSLKIQENERIILFVGGLRQVKGARYLIEAMKIITDKYKNTRLLVIGDGNERGYLEDLVKRLDLQKYVTFIGKVPNERIPEYMVASDIFVLPSLSEGFPVTVLEAMASGLPVVTTDVRGLPEIVKEGENGFLVKPEDPREISKKVLLILRSNELRERLSNYNKEKSKQYSWESVVTRLEDVYHMVSFNKHF